MRTMGLEKRDNTINTCTKFIETKDFKKTFLCHEILFIGFTV